jgi:hypothetical protein
MVPDRQKTPSCGKRGRSGTYPPERVKILLYLNSISETDARHANGGHHLLRITGDARREEKKMKKNRGRYSLSALGAGFGAVVLFCGVGCCLICRSRCIL